MGPALALRAEQVLHWCIPYPRDDSNRDDLLSCSQFHVYEVTGGVHVISDSHKPFEDDVLVPTNQLRNRDFCVADFYTSRLAQRYGLPKETCRHFYRGVPMGNTLGLRIVMIL
ncbi:hypothetical protein BDN67DRAFT_871883, partial [Paxillus ammoniavirescens]